VANVKEELVDRLRSANNVLVTVSNNPSVDQLAAAIGLTLVLNKLDKHATAVYSGKTPSTIEFLQPDKTLEKNTDSLRDFIIALDRAKADKLRYKVEDKFVKIFITPYHSSLSDKDLEFSQGDFNVDVVVAIGVHKREELDDAITAHGRILHDAVTASINNKSTSELGTLNWFQVDASSLCEMVVSLLEPLQGDKAVLDSQIATAFLTGIVAETERFSNEKTTTHTMNIAATLMKGGADQQLVSSKLTAPEPKAEELDKKKLDEIAKEPGSTATPAASKDGALSISHKKEDDPKAAAKTLQDLERENREKAEEEDDDLAKIHIDEEGKLRPADQIDKAPAPSTTNMVLQPPTLGGDLSSATKASDSDSAAVAAIDEPPKDTSSLQHAKTIEPLSEEEKVETLAQIEEKVDSPHLGPKATSPTDLPPVAVPAPSMPLPSAPMPSAEDAARQAVSDAAKAAEPTRLEPISALNAQPVDLKPEESGTAASDLTTEEIFPPQLVGPDKGLPPDPTAAPTDPSAPPEVPPPPVVPPPMLPPTP
jgi:nanoRNase/pAp phosphatase (c-di-AMP/oligoRNAs hydrolase)